MSRWQSLIYLLPQLWHTLISRPITVPYPFAPLKLPQNFRGRVRIEPDLCRGCGACARDCPAAGLELQREGRDRFRLIHYPDRCAYCGQCEQSCRFGAIRLTNEFVPGTPRRETLTEILVESWTLSKGHLSGIPEHNMSPAWVVKSRPRMGNLVYKRVEITVEPHNTGHR